MKCHRPAQGKILLRVLSGRRAATGGKRTNPQSRCAHHRRHQLDLWAAHGRGRALSAISSGCPWLPSRCHCRAIAAHVKISPRGSSSTFSPRFPPPGTPGKRQGALASPHRPRPRVIRARWPGLASPLARQRARTGKRDHAGGRAGAIGSVLDLSPHVAGEAEAAAHDPDDLDSLALRPRARRTPRAGLFLLRRRFVPLGRQSNSARG